MARDTVDVSSFHRDVREFIILLHRHRVRYLIVGGEAVIYHGHARLTGDIDFFYDLLPNNAVRLFKALNVFWKDNIPGVKKPEELSEEGVIVQFGVPPLRIDLLNRIEKVAFHAAWRRRMSVTMEWGKERIPVYYLSLGDLIKNKQAVGRPKDLEDLKFLRRAMCAARRRKRKSGSV